MRKKRTGASDRIGRLPKLDTKRKYVVEKHRAVWMAFTTDKNSTK